MANDNYGEALNYLGIPMSNSIGFKQDLCHDLYICYKSEAAIQIKYHTTLYGKLKIDLCK